MPTNLTLMPEIFQKAGYSTHLVGKWHLGFAKREYTPTYRGFDNHYGYWGGFIDYYQRRSQMPVSLVVICIINKNLFNFHCLLTLQAAALLDGL